MKKLLQMLIAILGVVFTYLVVMQGFAAPQLDKWVDLALRIAAALCLQITAIQLTKKTMLRLLPVMVTGCFAVLGLFLLLTSPSWRQATVGGFLMDYVSPFAACSLTVFLWKVGPYLKNL